MTLHIERPAIPLFLLLFRGKGKFKYMSCNSKEEVRGKRNDPDWHLDQLSWRRGVGEHAMYCDKA
jgi:hypothetical protein